MISEDYVSFETAKLLKEKGFDEKCYLQYKENGTYIVRTESPVYNSLLGDNDCGGPTQSIAMKWLRELHNIVIVIDICRETGREGFYGWQLENNCTGDWINNIVGECPTYEQACDIAIKYCLREIV